ncbi:MAG: YaiI/YqxD family protein [Sodalis sp. (in: enterobacteria)]
MEIWVDADACPRVIKAILFRVAERHEIQVTLIANQSLQVPSSRFIVTLRVAGGLDMADDEIVKRAGVDDLVITADIPLAAEVLAKGARALNPRGELYQQATIREKLTLRDFMDTLRGSGIQTGGTPPLRQRERQEFARQLDKWLCQVQKVKRH